MNCKLNIVFLIFALHVSFTLHAQSTLNTAQDYFNEASKRYVNKDIAGALSFLDKGFEKYPEDVKLNELTELILREQEQQQQSCSSNQNKDQQKQQKDQQKDQEKKEKDQEKDQQKEKKEQNKEQQPEKKDGLSKEEAEKILNALQKQEQDVKDKADKKLIPVGVKNIEKDW